MVKTKLIDVRKSKKISPKHIAEQLDMDVSCYYKRERGEIYIRHEEWEHLAQILDVPFNEIYQSDENQSNICKDKASANVVGTNLGTSNFYTVPENLLETQQKYIAKLEEEIEELKQLLKKEK